MEQFHLNDYLERATKFFLRVEKTRGFMCTWFGTFTSQDYKQSEKYMSALETLIEVPAETRTSVFKVELPKIKTGVYYARDVEHQIKVNLDDVSNEQFSKAFDYLQTALAGIDPKPVRPAA